MRKGKGAGKGYTLNLPMPPRSDDSDYLQALKTEALPRLKQFAPQFLLISAGFDAHFKDPLAHMHLTREGYRDMAELLLDLAQETAGGQASHRIGRRLQPRSLWRSAWRTTSACSWGYPSTTFNERGVVVSQAAGGRRERLKMPRSIVRCQ